MKYEGRRTYFYEFIQCVCIGQNGTSLDPHMKELVGCGLFGLDNFRYLMAGVDATFHKEVPHDLPKTIKDIFPPPPLPKEFVGKSDHDKVDILITYYRACYDKVIANAPDESPQQEAFIEAYEEFIKDLTELYVH